LHKEDLQALKAVLAVSVLISESLRFQDQFAAGINPLGLLHEKARFDFGL